MIQSLSDLAVYEITCKINTLPMVLQDKIKREQNNLDAKNISKLIVEMLKNDHVSSIIPDMYLKYKNQYPSIIISTAITIYNEIFNTMPLNIYKRLLRDDQRDDQIT